MTVVVTVDRDSVAMGDDVESHERTLELAETATLQEVLALAGPDASVSGGACWVLYHENRPLGLWAQGTSELRLVDPAAPRIDDHAVDGRLDLDFWYATQADPDLMFEVISAGSPNRAQALAAYHSRVADAAVAAAASPVAPGRFFSGPAREALESVGFTIELESPEGATLELDGQRYDIGSEEQEREGLPERMIRVAAAASVVFASQRDDAARVVIQLAGEGRRARLGLTPYRWPKTYVVRLVDFGGGHWGYRWNYGGLERRVDFGSDQATAARFANAATLPLADLAAYYRPDEKPWVPER